MITIHKEPPYVLYRGATFIVEWYIDPAGKLEAKGYYESLPIEDRKRLNDLVAYLADAPIGTRLSSALYNLEDAENQIYAFKPRDHRFFDFMTAGSKIVIINAYRKHSQRMTKKDKRVLKAAVDAKSSYFLRMKAGTYYEWFS